MERMEDYKDLYEASFKKFRVGDIVKGTVISVDENGAVIDLNYYAPGFIAVDEFSDNPDFSIEEEVKVGDEVTAVGASDTGQQYAEERRYRGNTVGVARTDGARTLARTPLLHS